MDLELAKAIYAAGFRKGVNAGSEAATAFEWGEWRQGYKTLTAESSWLNEVEWMLDTNSSYKLDINKIEDWNSI